MRTTFPIIAMFLLLLLYALAAALIWAGQQWLWFDCTGGPDGYWFWRGPWATTPYH